jgi:hypothetical protein
MQPKSRFLVLGLSTLLTALLLGGCGGGDTGKTWFNLPSLEVAVNEAGQAKVAGFTLPAPVLQPAQIEQLQAAGVDQIEARIGYGGIHALVNGEDLPYLAWDEESTAVVQETVRSFPGIPNANLIANLLPALRTYGLGAAIKLPGAAAADVPRWRGETLVAPAEAVDPPTIGPIDISSITFTPEGRGYIGPVPLDALGAPVNLPADLTGLVTQLGIESLTVDTEPTGLSLSLNDGPFPDLAYDAERLARLMPILGAFLPDSPLLDTVGGLVDQLPGADVKATVTFNGEPAGGLVLDNLRAAINADGSVDALGLPLPVGTILPEALLGQLAATGLERLSVNLAGGEIALANNGQPFPKITLTDAGQRLLTSLAPALGMAGEQVGGILDVVGQTDVAVDVSLPGAEGAPAADTPAPEVAEFAPVDLGAFAPPVIRASLAVDAAGNITQIGNVAATDLASVGLTSLALPANVMQILQATGADTLELQTANGHADVLLDGEVALGLDYDADSLRQLLATAKPFLNIDLLNNPGVSRIIDEVVMPLAPGAQIDLSIDLP